MCDQSAIPDPDRWRRLFSHARGVLRDWVARHALRHELLECDRSGVLDNVLADLQIDRGALEPMIENYPLSTRLFGRMAARLGVDPMADGPQVRRAIQQTCALCAHQGACGHWLDSDRAEGYEEFCPNADYWHALKERIRIAAARR